MSRDTLLNWIECYRMDSAKREDIEKAINDYTNDIYDPSLLLDVNRLCRKITDSDPQTTIKGDIESMPFFIAHHPKILAADA